MDTPTHALIPVIIYGVMHRDVLASGERSEKIGVWRNAAIIGFVGCMPDMFDPHVSLEDRLSSWTHCLTAWVGFSALLGLVTLVRRRWLTPLFALGISLTYASHIVGDAIAGGIGWAYPFSNHVIGDYYVIPEWWIPADFICGLGAYFVYRLLPQTKARRLKREAMLQQREAALADAGIPPAQ